MKRVLVTGGAGFIPSHLEDLLIEKGCEIVSVDISENCGNIEHLMDRKDFQFFRMDVNDTDSLAEVSKGCDMVFHMAANSDIRAGGQDPKVDYEMTFSTTRSVMETMLRNGIRNVFFSSTSAVYGDMKGKLNETTGGLRPISYYGAYKLASEAIISSYAYMNDLNALVFRFPNVVGPRLTHGVIFDFIKKLDKDPEHLEILGDGRQNKQYVYVKDLVKGIVGFSENMGQGYELYNISTDSFTDVNTIAGLVCERLGLKDVKYTYTGGTCGWKGDVSSFEYDVSKAKSKGWSYEFDSTGAVRETLRNLDIDSVISR